MVVVLRLARQGHWRASDSVMLGTAALWVLCTVVYWWLWGVGFDAADAFQPEPDIMKWYEPSFLVGLGSFITFWVAFLVSVIHRTSDTAAS
jgi:hypothetical protein